MKKVILDKYTESQAREYANIEADIHNFKIGGPQWKKAFKDYVSEAYSTMAVGRNPRVKGLKYKLATEAYPQVFGEEGFAGKVAANYIGDGGKKGVPISVIQDRILAAVGNLNRLHINGIMGIKTTTTTTKQGEIPTIEMSDLQLPKREEFPSDEKYRVEMDRVIRNWYALDLVSNAILEGLHVFFTLSRADVEEILQSVTYQGSLQEAVSEGRVEFTRKLRELVKPKLAKLIYKKLLLGSD